MKVDRVLRERLEKKTVEELLALTDLWASSWAYLMGFKKALTI
ncbi:unnamed protein product [Brassica oleracea var. botrytis]